MVQSVQNQLQAVQTHCYPPFDAGFRQPAQRSRGAEAATGASAAAQQGAAGFYGEDDLHIGAVVNVSAPAVWFAVCGAEAYMHTALTQHTRHLACTPKPPPPPPPPGPQVYNRPVLLIDMDDYTRRWYCALHGVEPGSLRPIEVTLPEWAGTALGCTARAVQRVWTCGAATARMCARMHGAHRGDDACPLHAQVDFERRVRRPPDVVPPNELPIGDEADTAANASRLVSARP